MSTLSVDTIQGKTAAGTVAMPSGHIIQTLSSTKLTAQGTQTGSYVDISDLAVTITPKFSTSKILITVHVYASYTDAGMLRILRDTTRIPNNTEGSTDNNRGYAMVRHEQGNEGNIYSFTHLDAPSTTSATTYKVQAQRNGGSGTMEINRRYSNTDYSCCSSITVQEISQ
mgnify:FL=1|tara:strand:+ start:24 stop:533 length:510 start_codon:yes stop_codon:yes gene_type:complete